MRPHSGDRQNAWGHSGALPCLRIALFRSKRWSDTSQLAVSTMLPTSASRGGTAGPASEGLSTGASKPGFSASDRRDLRCRPSKGTDFIRVSALGAQVMATTWAPRNRACATFARFVSMAAPSMHPPGFMRNQGGATPSRHRSCLGAEPAAAATGKAGTLDLNPAIPGNTASR